MKLTDLEIGQFATRTWHKDNKSSLCIKRYSQNSYECWEDGNFSSIVLQDSTIFNHTDFKLCDCNGKLIEEFTYPLFMENIAYKSTAGRIVKFTSKARGMVIIKGNSSTDAGYQAYTWMEHTNTKHWKPCDFSKAPEVDDIDYWDARFNAGLPVCYSNKEGINNVLLSEKPSDYVKYQTKGTYKFHILGESKPEFTYPIYFESYVSSAWIAHTNKEDWKQVNFDEKLNKIIPTTDDIDELISDLKSIIEDDDNRFSPSEYGAGTQLRESGYDQCHDLIDEWLEKYHINKAPDIDDEKNFKYFDDLVNMIMHIEDAIQEQKSSEPIIGVDYASQSDISYVLQNGISKRIYNDDTLDALSYAIYRWNNKNTGATENEANNQPTTKEFTMNKELQDAILELIATNGQPKVKKPKTAKIVCNVEGTLMEFADEAALKQFMWSSRVESVIRYDLAGKVTVPFELSVEAPKNKASK